MAGRILLVLIAIISLNTGILNETNAEDKEVATPQRGLPVTLRVGPGFDRLDAIGIADDLRAEGCPTVVTDEPVTLSNGHKVLLKNKVIVDVEGFVPRPFSNAGSAGASALRKCLSK